MTKRLLLAAALCIAGASTLLAQNIRNHYVSKAETDGVIYHTFPVTLFENREAGDLTFDITYKEHRGGAPRSISHAVWRRPCRPIRCVSRRMRR